MTEKIQFDFKDEYITLNGGVFATARTKLDAELISKVINELLKENQQYKLLTDELKRQNKKLKSRLNDLGVEYYD